MNDSNITSIAVIVAGIDEEYQNNIISGINKFAKEKNINISYFAAFGGMLGSSKFDAGEYSIYNLVNYDNFDGAILMTNTICADEVKEKIINNVRESDIPAVVFDCNDYPEFYNIRINNTAAMRCMVQHVIEKHNAKVINFISGPLSNPEANERYNAFLDVMKENSLPIDENRIYFGEFRSHDGKLAIDEFFESGLALPDAFICANDAMALTAVSALEKSGCKVPEDVIVTGFDNTYNARNFCPALTSVSRPLADIGYKACEIITDILNGKKPEKTITFDSEPVFSESCGCTGESADDFRSYKKSAYNKIQNINSGISLLNRLTAGLAEAEETDDDMNVLKNFVDELDCEKFCICLADDWLDTFTDTMPFSIEDSYVGYMTAPLIWDKGEQRSVGYFPSRDMFPEQFETGGNISYFLPLHFRERCLGYYIITNSDFPAYSLLCHSVTMNISSSLENVRKIIHLNKAMDELNRLYVMDPLCNIYNRNGFINLADERFRKCMETNQKVMLTFIDMDGLKFINDNYGHNEGDDAIKRLANVIQESCSPTSICARFGGDEFVVFDTNVSEGDAETLKRRFNKKIDQNNVIIKKPYTLSASIGSVITEACEGITLYGIISQADSKMYEVKKQKKNSRSGSAQ